MKQTLLTPSTPPSAPTPRSPLPALATPHSPPRARYPALATQPGRGVDGVSNVCFMRVAGASIQL